MTTAAEQGSQLVMPLLRLAPADRGHRRVDEAIRHAPRLLHLDGPANSGFTSWVGRVREAAEDCLLVDAAGRVAAMSIGCGLMLNVDPAGTVGVLLLDLVVMVDFSAMGVPIQDPELQAPPLRVLKSGGMARGLVRLRRPSGVLMTYDVVAVPLAGRVGALAFLTEV